MSGRSPDPTSGYRTSITIGAPAEHGFRFWTEAELVSTWIGRDAAIDPRPGGEFRFEIAPGEWCAGSVIEVDPPRRIVVTWGWESGRIDLPSGSSRVEVELSAVDGGTRLDLVHRGLAGDVLRLHADGWPRFLGRLDRTARGLDSGTDPALEGPEEALTRLEET